MADILVNYLGENGAGPMFSLEMARGMAQNGHNVYAMISSRSLNLKDWQQADFLKKLVVLDTYASKKDYLMHLPKYTEGIAKKASQELSGLTFDAVIRTFPHPMLAAAEKKLSIRRNITLCHDPINHSGEPLSARIRNKQYMNQAQNVIVLTKAFIPLITQNYGIPGERVYFMPHGMMTRYRQIQQEKPLVTFDESKVNYVFFGRIEDYKGIPVLLKAFQFLQEKYDNITLTIAGKGNILKYRDEIEKTKNLTVIARYISDEEVGGLFDSKSVVAVIPYVDATQSGVIPIALEYGNSIVATATGGLKEQLSDGRVGIFAKPGDAVDLANKMAILLEKKERERQGEMGKELARELSFQKVTEVIDEILKGPVSNNK